jgi:hypothetical protein
MYTHYELDRANGTGLRRLAKETGFKGYSKLKVHELRQALRDRLPARQGTSPTLFVELCAGTAALSLRLHREGAKPPVSRMGAKTGYANAILHHLDLYPGLQADHYLWCEPDAGCRLLLEAYRDHDLAMKAVDIIRGWKNEDPRALWERLRKEGPVKAPTPREVARWTLALPGGAWTSMPPKAMYKGPGDHPTRKNAYLPSVVADGYDNLDTLPADLSDGAVEPPLLPPNTVVYIDPPYEGVNGYGHELPRKRVVDLALKWYAAGAKVCISEQVAIPELVALGWKAVDITGERQGQQRSFSHKKTEFLTISPE